MRRRGQGPRQPAKLDHFTLAGLQASKKFDKRVREFHWRMYSELAFQRSEILDKIREALLKAAIGKWVFKGYQRVVKHRWALKPLSAGGSLKFPGGRFNIGDLDPEYPSFPALYLTIDKETALQEVLGQDAAAATSTLAPFDVALTKKDSISFFSMSGSIETVIDLGNPGRLEPLVALIKDFRLSPETLKLGRDLAKETGRNATRLVTTVKDLRGALLAPFWRELPVQLGIPSTSQTFGQLVRLNRESWPGLSK